MPAAEREILSALYELSMKDSTAIENVLVVVAKGSSECRTFMELLEEKKVNCTLIENGLKGLCESASRGINVFDAVIISKLIVEDHLIGKPSELDSLAKSILKVLKNDGVAIIREDLDGYRATEKVCQFTSFFDLFSDRLDDSTSDVAGFDFYSLKQLNATIHTTRNFFDFLWVLKKKQHSEHVANGSNEEKAKTEKKTFRDFLDTTQYTDEGIRAYEWVFGNHFISPGGYEENLKVLKRFGELKVASKMLDIGVGIGGGARQAAKEFGLLVHGIDISANMLATGMDRLQDDKDTRIRYQICDALNYKFPSNHFDYVFSRDCLHHVEHMRIIFSNIFDWLKPGGKFLITVYGKGHGAWMKNFEAYVSSRRYYLRTLDEHVELAKASGFVDVEGMNQTKRLRQILIEERTKALQEKDKFLEKFDSKTFDKLMESWDDKIGFIDADNFGWFQISGVKPLLCTVSASSSSST